MHQDIDNKDIPDRYVHQRLEMMIIVYTNKRNTFKKDELVARPRIQ